MFNKINNYKLHKLRYTINTYYKIIERSIMTLPKTPFKSHRFVNKSSGKFIKLYAVRHISFDDHFKKLNEDLAKDIEKGFVIHTEGISGIPDDLPSLHGFYKKYAEGYDAVLQYYSVAHINHDAHWDQLSIMARMSIRGMLKLFELAAGEDGEFDFKITDEKIEEFNNLDKSPQSFISSIVSYIFGGVREREAVKAALATTDSVSMVWGALHMPSFQKKLEKAGYRHYRSEAIV